MVNFEQREEGFERAFSHQEELRFKTRVRRNLLLGAWAGEKLGLTGEPLQSFVARLVERQLEGVDDEALVAELAEKLEKREPSISRHRIGRRLEEFSAQALRDIQAGR